MPTPDSEAVLKTLRQATEFTRKVGAKKEAAALERFCERFQCEAPSFKLLQSAVDEAMNDASERIQELLLNEQGDPRPGKKPLVSQHERIWVGFLKLMYPPEWEEMDVKRFAGSKCLDEKTVSYKGDPGGVRPIVEGELIQRYSQLIGTSNFKTAWQFTDSGLRAAMNFQKLVREHEKAAQQFNGPALEFRIGQFAYVYSDDEARKKSNTAEEGWPKTTAKENRCGRVVGFWIRNRARKTGSGGALWIAREGGQYRIANFDFWRP